MFKSPRRNGRNKGFKIKHVLQISALFGASIWLLYQVQHTDNKKPVPIRTNISENLHNDSSKDMIKLGRKGLRPRGKETNVQDKKETIQHEADHEDDNENEAEELLVQRHESKDMKHDEVGENVRMNDGREKNTKTGSEELKVEIKGHENEEIKEKENGVQNEKIKTDGMKQTHEEAIKEANRSKKSKEGNMKMDMSIPIVETNKESRQEGKNEENGRKKEVKEEKEDDNEIQPNPNEVVEIASPPEDEDDDEENVSSEEVNDNRRRKENGEKREENGSSIKGPRMDESESGSNPIYSKSTEDDKDSSSNSEKPTEEETSSTKFVKNRKIGNLSRQRMWIKSVKKKTNPVASFEPKKTEVK